MYTHLPTLTLVLCDTNKHENRPTCTTIDTYAYFIGSELFIKITSIYRQTHRCYSTRLREKFKL